MKWTRTRGLVVRGPLVLVMLLAVAACGDDGEQALPPADGDTPSAAAACLEGTEDCDDTLFPGDEPQVGLPPSGDADDLVTGGTLSVSEALEATGTITVKGYYVDSGDGPRLCEALAESFPPQCGGVSVELADTSVIDPDGVQTNQSTSWSNEPVTIVGEIVDGVLVPTTMSA